MKQKLAVVISPLACVAFLTLSLFGINTLSAYPSLIIGNYQIFSYSYSISIINTSATEVIYKISPYDDSLIFPDNYWRAVVTNNEDLENEAALKLRKAFWRLYQNLLEMRNQAKIAFASHGDYDVHYTAAKNGPELKIKRVIGETAGATDLGKAFAFGSTDIVFDSRGTIYTDPKNVETIPALTSAISRLRELNQAGDLCYLAVTHPDAPGMIVLPIEKGEMMEVDTDLKKAKITKKLSNEGGEMVDYQILEIFSHLKDFVGSGKEKCQD